MKSEIKMALLIGALVGAGIGIASLVKENKLPASAVPFSLFADHQVNMDVLDGATLMRHIRKHTEGEGDVCAAFFPTPDMIGMFHLTGVPGNIDSRRNLLLAIYDSKRSKVISTELISFSEMSETLRKHFATKDYMLIEEA